MQICENIYALWYVLQFAFLKRSKYFSRYVLEILQIKYAYKSFCVSRRANIWEFHIPTLKIDIIICSENTSN